MFDDPTTMGLLGLAQGFGQAAMPSRMPVSFGAAMGMGGAGMMQGAQAGLAGQQQEQALAASTLQNQMTRAMLPARIHAFQGAFGGGGGSMPGSLSGPQMNQQPGLLRQAANWVGNQFDPSSPQQAPGPAPQQGLQSPSGAQQQGGADQVDPATQALQQMGAQRDYYGLSGDGRTASNMDARIQSSLTAGAVVGTDGVVHMIPHATQIAFGMKKADAAGTGAGAQPYTQQNALYDANLKAGLQGNEAGLARGTFALNQGVQTWQDLIRGQNAAQTDIAKAGQMPTSFTPGSVVGTPNAMRGGGGISPGAFVQAINGSESGGDPNATNGRSSATGPAQFTDATFLPLFRRAFPSMGDLSDAQALRMRTMPGVSDAMTAANAQQNAGTMGSGGFQPTSDNLALAHRFGAGGAMSLLRADPTTPISDTLVGKGVMAANPDLNGQTAGGVVGNTRLRFGTAPVQFGPAPTSGRVPLDPVGQSQLTEQSDLGKSYAAMPERLNGFAKNAAYSNSIIDRTEQAIDATKSIQPGRFAPAKTYLLSVASSLGMPLAKYGVKGTDLANAQVSEEGITQLGNDLIHQMVNGGEDSEKSFAVKQQEFTRLMPKVANMEMDPAALRQMFTTFRAQNDYSIAKADAMNAWQRDPANGNSLRGFEPTFFKTHGYSPAFAGLTTGGTPPAGNATPTAAAPAQTASAATEAPPEAVAHLRSNPKLWQAFEAKYGQGSATPFLQQQVDALRGKP